jgi:GntR family transcriptional regulator of arabinose operon
MKETLYRKIYSALVDDIQRGTYPIGSRIPSEMEISKRFGVSRITSKKAFEMLAADGYINRFAGRGSFVAQRLDSPPQNAAHEAAGREALKRGELTTVGLVMGNVAQSFGARAMIAIERACAREGYNLLFGCSMEDQLKETEILQSFFTMGVSAVIILPVHGKTYNPHILRLLGSAPVVLMDRRLSGIPFPSVSSDHFLMAKQLTDHLFDAGHRKLAFINTRYYETTSILERVGGFVKSNIDHGCPTMTTEWTDESTGCLIENLPGTRDQDMREIQGYLERHPEITGFVAVEFEIALMLREMLARMGRLDTQRESIACFDAYLNYVDACRFTSAVQDEEAIGSECVRLLMELIQSGHTADRVIVPHTIQYA